MFFSILSIVLSWLDEKFTSPNGPDIHVIRPLAAASWQCGERCLTEWRSFNARCYMSIMLDLQSYGHLLSNYSRHKLTSEMEKQLHRDAELYLVLRIIGALTVQNDEDITIVDDDIAAA